MFKLNNGFTSSVVSCISENNKTKAKTVDAWSMYDIPYSSAMNLSKNICKNFRSFTSFQWNKLLRCDQCVPFLITVCSFEITDYFMKYQLRVTYYEL